MGENSGTGKNTGTQKIKCTNADVWNSNWMSANEGGSLMLNKLKIRKNLYNVRIVNGDSKIETVALEDTGNSLREPYKGRPVSVLQYNVIKQILTGNEKCFLIPFKSVGSQNGILTGITVDYM